MDAINSLLFLVFCGVTATALLTFLNLLLPGRVERVREKLDKHFVRSFVIGLVALGLSFAILLLLAYIINRPVFNSMARENVPYIMAVQTIQQIVVTVVLILIALALVSASAIGLAAIASSLGRRIGTAMPSMNPNLVGATLLVLSGLTPFLGWFIFAPVVFCIGFGATIQAIFQRKATRPGFTAENAAGAKKNEKES